MRTFLAKIISTLFFLACFSLIFFCIYKISFGTNIEESWGYAMLLILYIIGAPVWAFLTLCIYHLVEGTQLS